MSDLHRRAALVVACMLAAPDKGMSQTSDIDQLKKVVALQQAKLADLASAIDSLKAPWLSYVPVVQQDGTPASVTVLGNTVRYKRIGNTVLVQGYLILGERAPGQGGTFIKLSLPINGRQGVDQFGIGAVDTYAVQAHNAVPGSGVIYGVDPSVIRFKKGGTEERTTIGLGPYFRAEDARHTFGVIYALFGSYEVDP